MKNKIPKNYEERHKQADYCKSSGRKRMIDKSAINM